MRVRFSLPGEGLRLDKLVAGIRTPTDYERVAAVLEDGMVVGLEPGPYVVRKRQSGKPFARFYVPYRGDSLQGWFEEEPPDCVEAVK